MKQSNKFEQQRQQLSWSTSGSQTYMDISYNGKNLSKGKEP